MLLENNLADRLCHRYSSDMPRSIHQINRTRLESHVCGLGSYEVDSIMDVTIAVKNRRAIPWASFCGLYGLSLYGREKSTSIFCARQLVFSWWHRL